MADKAALQAHVTEERRALSDDLADVSPERWQTASLCGGWTVHDVLAHMTATARISPATFLPKLIGAGFSFDRLQDKGIKDNLGKSPGDTLSGFRNVITSTSRPPGPIETMAGEVLVHSEDIRRSLGIKREYPVDLVVTVADFYKGSNLILGTKRRIEGVRLRTTDTEWAHGSGPEVSGPAISLLVAMTGRKQALDDLTGPGVEILRSRP